jgi:hypothetical protein
LQGSLILGLLAFTARTALLDAELAVAGATDLTVDGGAVKTVIRKAKADAVAPSDILPLVEGISPHLAVASSNLCGQALFPDARLASEMLSDHRFMQTVGFFFE